MRHYGCAFLLAIPLSANPQNSQQLPSQTTNGPCSPIFNGSGNVQNCNTPPPTRTITLANANLAITELKKRAGATIQLARVGRSPEIDYFVNTIATLFSEGKWQVASLISMGTLNNSVGGVADHGEGVRCSGKGPDFDAATKALTLAGHPCIAYASWMFGPQRPPPDVYIQIGTRILPQD